MARPLHCNGGRPPAGSIRIVRIVNSTTIDIEATRDGASHAARVVLYGGEIRVRGDALPRAVAEAVRRWARGRAEQGGPIAEW